MTGPDGLRLAVERYYSGRFAEHGPTARGVDWRDGSSQELRFEQLLKVADLGRAFSLTDYGCGYGALAAYLDRAGLVVDYRGFDLSEPMLQHARRQHRGQNRFFTDQAGDLEPSDYTVASGVFNVRLESSIKDWEKYVLLNLAEMARLSVRGFAFNMLTSYSDPDRMRADLFYADPAWYFDHCKRNFSKSVALLHDYGLYEFTIIVRL